MDKGDLQFVISTILAVLGLLGLDWKLVRGRVPKVNLSRRDISFLLAIGLSVAFSLWGFHEKASGYIFDPSAKSITVEGKTFLNTEVPLDGYEYRYCQFKSVTFIYEGKTRIKFNHNELSGQILIHTDNPSLEAMASLMKGIGMLGKDIPILGPDNKPIDGISSPNVAPNPAQPQ
jgi:hypothetical protein